MCQFRLFFAELLIVGLLAFRAGQARVGVGQLVDQAMRVIFVAPDVIPAHPVVPLAVGGAYPLLVRLERWQPQQIVIVRRAAVLGNAQPLPVGIEVQDLARIVHGRAIEANAFVQGLGIGQIQSVH